MKQVQNMGFGNAHYFKDVASPKLDEIKQLLDNNSSSSKLEGMKRLIAMISKGKDVSSFFPDVVKNVICPSPEVKKLVYNYLIHYAEFQQDAALLSINTFQKDLDNSNQLIRAQALRILTSIRLKVIVQIQVLAVKKCVTDSSPYVRKTAAHAIPKVYHIDPSQKIELIECIETLLGDNTTLVLGSAIGAFNEVCPDRYDLLHGHYRKICGMLADFDEWGQVYTINILTRYVRKHFVDPNPNSLKAKTNGEVKKKSKGFYSDSESEESEEEDDYGSDLISEMDADHRTALRVTLPLLQSRNTAVTLAVASLFFYCAPHAEALRAGKALVRACRAHREIQFLLLQNIATMAVSRPELFAPYVSEFFIDETDPVLIRNTKLEILTCVATESNIARILRELTHYVHREEKEFVKCVIQAIVKCASRLEEVQDTCMHGLMSLISNPSDTVVAESVIAIKKLLQMGAGEDKRIVKNLVKLLDKIKVPSARASIIWCVGEYSSKIPKIAPDVLRKLAQTFSDEDSAVRMQILNLGCKLVLNNPHQTQFIFQYVINLAKYDVSYDIRDRARTLRSILTRPGSALLPFAKRLFSAEKPAPEDHFPYKERERWALGSISHSVGQTAAGYTEIPEWTAEVQGTDERNVVPKKQRKDFVGMGSDSVRFTPPPAARSTSSSSQTIDDFYGDNDRSRSRSRSYSRSRSGSYSRSRSGSYSRSRSRSGSYSRSRSRSRSYSPSQSRSRSRTPPRRGRGKYRSVSPSRSPSGSRSRSRSYSPSGSDRDYSDDDRSPQKKGGDDLQSAFFGSPVASPGGQSLLEAFGGASLSSSPLLRPSSESILGSLSSVSFGGGAELPREVLLKKVVGNGLQVEYQFQRSISIRGPSYLPIRIWVQNASDTAITSVVISSVSSIDGAELIPFDLIPIVHPGATVEVIANAKFASFSDGLKFKIEHSNGSFPVSITVPVGELLKPEAVSVATFADLQKKWGGLQESSLSVSLGPKSASKVLDRVLSAANVGVVEVTASSLKLSGRATLSSSEQILIFVDLSGSPQVTSFVYSDNPILANNLNNAIAALLRN